MGKGKGICRKEKTKRSYRHTTVCVTQMRRGGPPKWMKEGPDEHMRRGCSAPESALSSQHFWATVNSPHARPSWTATPLCKLRAITLFTPQLPCLECKKYILYDFQLKYEPILNNREWVCVWAKMQDECLWKILIIIIQQKQANKLTNRQWSWRRLPANQSIETVLPCRRPFGICPPHVAWALKYWAVLSSTPEHPGEIVIWVLKQSYSRTCWASLGWGFKGEICNPKWQANKILIKNSLMSR